VVIVGVDGRDDAVRRAPPWRDSLVRRPKFVQGPAAIELGVSGVRCLILEREVGTKELAPDLVRNLNLASNRSLELTVSIETATWAAVRRLTTKVRTWRRCCRRQLKTRP
jgi:hypothetical protein